MPILQLLSTIAAPMSLRSYILCLGQRLFLLETNCIILISIQKERKVEVRHHLANLSNFLRML